MNKPMAEHEQKQLRSRLAEFIAPVKTQPLPPEVIDQTKRCLLDFAGVALGGNRAGILPALARTLAPEGDEADATIIGEGRKASALHAAFLNGVRGHALDMDDGHRFANGHPGVVVMPAALALAERDDLTGGHLIEAVVAGYEVFLRIAKSINPSHLMRGFHTTATIGPFGAAAACGKLLNLPQTGIENALSIAGLMGSGLAEVMSDGQMMKPFQTARASQAGLHAALLAKEGAEGPGLIFEGPKGFLRAYADDHQETAFADLGENYEILSVYFKMHAACRHVHSALDALWDITRRTNLDVDRIETIEIETYSVAFELTGRNRRADTEPAAKFSLPVSVALMLQYGRAGPDEYSLACIGNSQVRALADKVVIKIDPERDRVYPEKRGSRVKIVTADETYVAEVDLPKGEPENPFSEKELSDKFRRNAARVLSPSDAENIKEHILDLENRSVRDLMGFM